MPLLTKEQLKTIASPRDAVQTLRPDHPLYVFETQQIRDNALRFRESIPGTPLYAVKVNPHPEVLRALIKGGIQAFDVASLSEIEAVRKIAPRAPLYFMHPIKPRHAIRTAYHTHGVRAFSLDSLDELYKILNETDLASDLTLIVRVAVPKGRRVGLALEGKFGASLLEAIELLKTCRSVAQNLGLSFHVGSQCMDPDAFAKAIHYCGKIAREAGVTIDVLDVGGGFPSRYPDMAPPDMAHYGDVIRAACARAGFKKTPLLSEPGRALVADAGSLVVRVEGRKGDLLYINDGTYGGLFDAGKSVNFRYECIPFYDDARAVTAPAMGFRLAGPTCDSIDMMNGPFLLPSDIDEGDWIILRGMGAYSYNMRSNFNGFGHADVICL